MAQETGNAQKEPSSGRRPAVRIRWDAGTIIASLIGLLALLVAGYTAYIQRQQVRAQVWPHLAMGESDFLPSQISNHAVAVGPSASRGGFLMAGNSGVGPAIVRSVEVTVNGKPQTTWTRVFKALGVPSNGVSSVSSSLNHTVIPANGRVDMLVVFGQKVWLDFRNKFFAEATLRYCYCSTLHECWTGAFGKTGRTAQRAGGSCPKLPVSDQFKGE